MNENYMISNFSDDNMLKNVNEKNHLISKLENDMNEYKEKLKLLENKLSPVKKNL